MAEQVKVILWCCPRTVSTALLKCMSAVPDSQMIYELLSTVNLFGKERLSDSPPPPEDFSEEALEEFRQNPGSGFPDSIATWAWGENILQTGFQEKKLVFYKEMGYMLNNRYDILPGKGFRHAFLIRDPAKVFKSWKKLMEGVIKLLNLPLLGKDGDLIFDQLPEIYMPEGRGFKELYDMYNHIKEKGLDPDPVILDSDDILKDPAATISAFCKKLGIAYSDSLLTWEPGVEVVQKWVVSKAIKALIENEECFKNMRQSSGFKKPEVSNTPQKYTSDDMSPDIKRLVDFSMPYYNELYKHRLAIA